MGDFEKEANADQLDQQADEWELLQQFNRGELAESDHFVVGVGKGGHHVRRKLHSSLDSPDRVKADSVSETEADVSRTQASDEERTS